MFSIIHLYLINNSKVVTQMQLLLQQVTYFSAVTEKRMKLISSNLTSLLSIEL